MTRPHGRPTSRVTLMITLALTVSLASCAPSVQTGPAAVRPPDIRLGAAMLFVPRVNVAQFTEATPDDQFVIFPDCRNGVVAAADVKRLGVERAATACREAVTRERQKTVTVGNALPVMLSAAMIFFLYALGLL